MEHTSDSQIVDELNGQGPGDPDIHGHYPGDGGEKDCIYCNPALTKHATPSVYKIQPPKPDYGEQDNWAGDPEQAWA